MKFIYGKQHWKDIKQGQEQCYLLTNGLGGYASQSIIASCNRNDHALLMAGIKAPAERYNLITRVDESLWLEDTAYELSTQEYKDEKNNKQGFEYLNTFTFERNPTWFYQIKGIEIQKSIIMEHGKNTVGIRYLVQNPMKVPVKLTCTPQMQFVPKGEKMKEPPLYDITAQTIKSNSITLYYQTNGITKLWQEGQTACMYHGFDERAGRNHLTKTYANHSITFNIPPESSKEYYIIYSMEPVTDPIELLFEKEQNRQAALIHQAGIRDEIGKQLVQSADQFIVNRESTKEKTIIAGYPFFADWGRDTMIAVTGLCISTGRYEDAKSIFRSFMKYTKKGIMPNMFPETGKEPYYNTADASLLFIGAVYEYYMKTKDTAFIKESYPTMEEIIAWYQKGTDYHIRMDEDGLIQAGGDLEQVTWMDVRYNDILPTKRHGKPVEINSYWYNSLSVMAYFSSLLNKPEQEQNFTALKQKVKQSFQAKYINPQTGCLKDVLSGEKDENQIRCNQIWAVSVPFSPLSEDQSKEVLKKIHETLYTPIGLRTLDKEDEEYHGTCSGTQYHRDMAYHQGTVWPFPLGAYYLACLKIHHNSSSIKARVRQQLEAIEPYLREGCAGQIAEIYDGDSQTISRGCYAQAWSIGELLRVYEKLETQPSGPATN